MKEPFDPALYFDSFQKKLKSVIEAKIQGNEITVSDNSEEFTPMDLMDALTQSLQQVENRVH